MNLGRVERPPRGAWLCAGLFFVLQLGWGPRYPVFRDEFYYLACADYLAWGYVDHPPLSIAVLAVWRAFFGETLLSLRVLPSLAGAATVLLASALAGVLGGGSFARTLTAAAVLAAPTVFGITSFYSMNAFDFVFWIASVLLLARLCVAEAATRRRLWLMLGMMVGLGLLNKLSVGALGAGIGAAVLLTPLRSDLRTWSPWLGGVIALACVTPYALWQLQNDWPTIEFMQNAARHKNVVLGPMGFLLAQVQDFGPLNAVVWGTGLVWLVLGAGGRFRALAIVFVTASLVFMNGKAYYLAPALLVPLAAGTVAIERGVRAPRRVLARHAIVGLVLVTAAVPLPIVVPLLSPERLGGYMRGLGIVPEQAEHTAMGVLPQHFADRFGWEELTSIVARAWHSLTPEEQRHAIIVTSNYGEAGALRYYGPALGLPTATSQHNNFYLWGPGNPEATIVVAVGMSREDLAEVFEDVQTTSALTHPLAMPFEREHPVAIGRRPKVSLLTAWAAGKRFI